MKQHQRYFLTGLFTVTGFILFVLGCILFGSSELFTKKVYFETYFETSVQGLSEGGAVKFRGVQIGKVEQVTFAGDLYRDKLTTHSEQANHLLTSICVRCSVNNSKFPYYTQEHLEQMKAHGLRASLGTQGITGVVYINLDFERPDTYEKNDLAIAWEPDALYIPSTPAILQTLIGVVEKLGDSLDKIDMPAAVNAVTNLISHIDETVQQAHIPQLSANINSLCLSLQKQANVLEDALTKIDFAAVGKSINTIATNMASVSDTIRQELPPFVDNTQATMVEAQQAISSLKATLNEMTVTLHNLQTQLDFTELGSETDATLTTLSRTVAIMEDLMEKLREKPSRLLFDDDSEEENE